MPCLKTSRKSSRFELSPTTLRRCFRVQAVAYPARTWAHCFGFTACYPGCAHLTGMMHARYTTPGTVTDAAYHAPNTSSVGPRCGVGGTKQGQGGIRRL